ncbi:MAG: redox-regulated ATPase YchF [Leptospirales bacterium]
MGLSCGIVGLPNVGKSTLFNALTASAVPVANYPFCTIDPHSGIVPVPDHRLGRLSAMYQTRKTVPTTVEFVDIAGLVKGASEGEGLGNQFLGHIRSVDLVVHVLRGFEDGDITHVHGEVNPLSDLEVIETELLLSDLSSLSARLPKLEKQWKSATKEQEVQKPAFTAILSALEEGRPASGVATDPMAESFRKGLGLLTDKPALYVANVAETEVRAPSERVKKLEEAIGKRGGVLIPICAKWEAEIAELPEEERAAFLRELGLDRSGLDRLVTEGYRSLGLVTFLTAGEVEVRAWTVPQGTTAPKAAAEIHSDIERGFIRAEVMRYEDLDRLGSEKAVKEKGLLRLEGKEYVVQDGDVVYFRFHV